MKVICIIRSDILIMKAGSMKLSGKDLVLVFGTAFAWSQTLLDRSGIVLYGVTSSSFSQEVIWACLLLTAVVCTVLVFFFHARTIIPILCFVGIGLNILGSLLLLSLFWGFSLHGGLLIDSATLVFTIARAPVLQIWTLYLVMSKRAPRVILLVALLTCCIVLFTTALPSDEMHLISYITASAAGSVFLIFAPRKNLPEPTGAARHSLFGDMSVKAIALFCLLQIFPTLISGSIGAVEMYVPLTLDSWQYIAAFLSGSLLLVLFFGTLNTKRVPDEILTIIPMLLTLCMMLPLGTAKSFTPKPMYILATQLGGDFEVLNIYRTRSRKNAPSAAFIFLGQTLVFIGLFIGSALTNAVLIKFGITAVGSGVFTSMAFAGLLILLAALTILLAKIQAGKAVQPIEIRNTKEVASFESASPGSESLYLVPQGSAPLDPAPLDPASNLTEAHLQRIKETYYLTNRETDMMRFLLSGYSRKKIAEELFISESTVKSHINNLYRKLGIHKRDELLDLVNDSIQA